MPEGEELTYLNDEETKVLSTDSFMCYKYVNAIKEGKLTPQLANMKCASLSHARWLTTGLALMFLRTREHGLKGKELQTLEILVKFCLQMYFKLYFDIPLKNRLEDGPYHVLSELRILKTLPKKIQDIITPYIRTGAWFSHSECCLLSLLASKEAEDRKFAVGIILKIRAGEEFGDTSERPRRTPKINLNASGLQNLIPWKIEDCHEPVFICKLSTSKIRELEDSPLSVPQFSIHTQSTERCVKMVTEAAEAVAGQDKRDGFIRSRTLHRQEMPKFKS